ncbi:pirin [Caballeronia hypogeia]|uniref:Pirin n=1 Tax=Caballeronia hypogeia TaxID=1777140 RepID=A0A158BMD9_9BURK|nr:pirin-like C-terminal cupin domain-containing protein [Caballeronia hypogeia]SAK71214.1 pirin [Caballeronia hypogeia]
MNSKLSISRVVDGHDMRIGTGFTAKHFSEDMFDGLIDPVVMVDHFHMTSPTFEPHPHAGISAVTYMFEDSTAPHVNYDSMGNNHVPIRPGELHWLAAGAGAVHTEQPEGRNPHVHALQIFVNLPAARKFDAPFATHVNAEDVPVHQANGVRMRVVAGESQGLKSTPTLPEPFTLLDVFLDAGASVEHLLPADWCAMICVVSGHVTLTHGEQSARVGQAQAIGVAAGAVNATLELSASENAHFALLSGRALREPLVKHGPFVMNTAEQINDRIRAYQRGDFGRLDMS